MLFLFELSGTFSIAQIRKSSVVTEISDWKDEVFEDNYQFKSIEELENKK